jgi:hypothetical protein
MHERNFPMSFDTLGSRPSYLTNLDFTMGINRDGIRFGGGAGNGEFARRVDQESGRVLVDLVTRRRETGGEPSPLDGLPGVKIGPTVQHVVPEPDSTPDTIGQPFEMPPQHVVDAKVINAKPAADPQVVPPKVAPPELAVDPKVIPDPKLIQDPAYSAGAQTPAGPALELTKPDSITKFPLVENGKLPAPETVQGYIAGTDSLLKNDGISDEQRRSACVDLYQMVMGMFDGTVAEYIFLPDDELSRRLQDGGELANLQDTVLNMRNYISTIKFLCQDYLFWHEMADIEDMERVLDDLEEAMNPSAYVEDAGLRERLERALSGARETGRQLRDGIGDAGAAAGRGLSDILRLFPPIPGLPGGDRRFGH